MIHKEPQKYIIEKMMVGSLEKNEMLELEEHLSSCQACQSYHFDLIHQKQAFLLQHPPSQIENKLKERGYGQHVSSDTFGTPYPILILTRNKWFPILTAFCLLFLITPWFFMEKQINPVTDIQYKGAHKFEALKIVSNTPIPLTNGEKVISGTTIQFLFDNTHFSQMTLLSLDHNAKLSIYFEKDACCSYPLEKGIRQSYPHSITLDESPNFEIFMGIFSDKQISDHALNGLSKNYTSFITEAKNKVNLLEPSEKEIKKLQKLAKKLILPHLPEENTDIQVFLIRKN